MTWQVWAAFLGASLAISLSPGAGAVTSMSTGLAVGLRRGYWNILGLQIGVVLQIAVVAAGLGALIAGSDVAFEVIKWFGVAYLAYLAVAQWRATPTEADVTVEVTELSPRALVTRGFLVNASNPKAVVFMLAVLPQFLDPARPLIPQYLVITATMVTVDVLVMTGYTGFAAKVLRALRSPRQQRAVNRGFACAFALAALLLALIRH
jgi:homoserine/homoserine lactone efflux protein